MDFRFTIALIYDFDGTLSPGNIQEYDFIPAVGKSNREFWTEANTLAERQDADMVLTYMARMIQEAKSKGLSLRREAFQESGRRVTLYKGVREWFARINAYGARRGIRILHYINSSGLKEIIEGTEIAHEFRKIYACSFLYDVDGIAYWPAVAVNYTNKTQFIFKDQQGRGIGLRLEAGEPLHSRKRTPVPFRRMIYVGDGTTDIPCMRLVKNFGGHSIAVYNPDQKGGRGADGLAHPRQPREPRLPGRLLRRRRGDGRAREDDHRQDRPRRPARTTRSGEVTMKPLRLRWLRTALLGYSPEWTAGVRRHPGLAAALPAATIGCAFVPYAGFPALAAAALLCAGLYARNEPLPLLLLCECSGARLLVRKIGTAWRNYFLAALPTAALTAALHPRTAWLAALWLPFAALLLAYAVLAKYARYDPAIPETPLPRPPGWDSPDSSSRCSSRNALPHGELRRAGRKKPRPLPL